MPIKVWSATASSNATADSGSGINFAEGQAPSSLNDSSRAMMAEVAKYLSDNDGTNLTAGTSTVYTLTNDGSFTALADGLVIKIQIDETCGASPTLNVNGLGAKKLRKFTGGSEEDLIAGDLVANGIYEMVYDAGANTGAGAWIVLNPAVMSAAWTSASVGAITSGSGAIASASGTCRYLKQGRTVFIQIDVTISNVGTAGTYVSIPLPFIGASNSVLAGRDTAASGKMLQGYIVTGNVLIYNYDGTFPAVNGSRLVLSGVYEANS